MALRGIVCLLAFFLFAGPTVGRAQSEKTAVPVSVQETMVAVLRFNPTLKAVQENRQALTHTLRQEQAGWYPRVDMLGAAQYGQGSTPGRRAQNLSDGQYSPGGEVGLQFSQTLWDGMATANRVRAAEHRLSSSSHRVMDNASFLALEGLIAHVDLQHRMGILKLTRTYAAQCTETFEKQKAKGVSGERAISDSYRARARVERVKGLVVEAEALVEAGRAAYTRLTGMSAPDNLQEAPLPEKLPDLDALISDAMRSNPKINAYEEDVRAVQSEREVINSSYQPQLTLELGPSYADNNSDLRDNYEWGMGAAMRMRWNFYNGGADQAQGESITAKIRQTRQEMYATADLIVEDIRNARVDFEVSRQAAKEYAAASVYNDKTRLAYDAQFVAGTRSLLDVQDAESDLFGSELQRIAAQATTAISAYTLQALRGSLLQDMQIDMKLLQAPADEDPAVNVRQLNRK